MKEAAWGGGAWWEGAWWDGASGEYEGGSLLHVD